LALHHRHGGEDHDDGEGRRHDREADGVRPLDGRLIGSSAALDPFLDVLHLDDRVIHQDADHEGERQQGHDVEAEAEQQHRREGRHQRQGHGDGGDDRRAPVPQEQEDHQGGQDHALQEHVHRGLIAAAGLIDRRQHLGEVDVRVRLFELGDRLDHPVLGIHLGGALGLGNLKGGDGLPFNREKPRCSPAPSPTCATSPRRT
jgi:hypothetical protein